MRERILVTGGAGFIGSAVCRHLVRVENYTVINIDKLTYASDLRSLHSLESNPHYHFHQADILNNVAMTQIFEQYQPTAVLHLAAESHVDRSINSARDFIDTNIVGTYQLLECARHYYATLPTQLKREFRFVHVSTDEVYGSLDTIGHFTERTPYQPSSPYSASKASSDHLAYAWFKTYGLPVIVSHCSNNYGPYQFPEKLIPLMILNALEWRSLPVYGDGSNIRDWIFVDDHVRGLVSILRNGRPGEQYNLGGNSERSNLYVVETIADVVDRLVPSPQPRRSLITFVEDRPGHDFRYAIDSSKALEDLEWQPHETFETGLERTIHWYLGNDNWWKPMREQVYGGARLGLIAS